MKRCGVCSDEIPEPQTQVCWKCWSTDRPIDCEDWSKCPTFYDGCNCSVGTIRGLVLDNDRLRRELADALSVTSRDGLLSSEWVLRTGKAERENAILRAVLERFAEHDCVYGDGCPLFIKLNHGPCVGCLARRGLNDCNER